MSRKNAWEEVSQSNSFCNVVTDYLTVVRILVYSRQSRNLFALMCALNGHGRVLPGVSWKISLHLCTATWMAFGFDYTNLKLSLYIFNFYLPNGQLGLFRRGFDPSVELFEQASSKSRVWHWHVWALSPIRLPVVWCCHSSFRKHIVSFLSFFIYIWISLSSSASDERERILRRREVCHYVWT